MSHDNMSVLMCNTSGNLSINCLKNNSQFGLFISFVSPLNKNLEGKGYLQANYVLLSVLPPIIILFGTVTNFLNLIVWTFKVTKTSQSVFLSILTILDLIGLFTEPFIRFFEQTALRSSNGRFIQGCKYVECMYTSIIISTQWISFFVCFDRATKLCFPERLLLTVRRAGALSLVWILIAVCLSFHYIVDENAHETEKQFISGLCRDKLPPLVMNIQTVVLPSYSFNWGWTNKLATCFFPITFTLASLIALHQMQKVFNKRQKAADMDIVRTMSQDDKDALKITYALGVLSMCVVVPVTIFKTQETSLNSAKLEMIYTIVSLPLYISFSVKIFIYWFCSMSFKRNFLLLCRLKSFVKSMDRLRQIKKHLQGRPRRLHLEPVTSITDLSVSANSPTSLTSDNSVLQLDLEVEAEKNDDGTDKKTLTPPLTASDV